MKKIIAEKSRMTQIFQDGKVIPVTTLFIKGSNEEIDFEKDLEPGLLVKVSGLNKGHGFQGVVKRHGFRGGQKTHGQKNRFRAPGSIGATAPQRVIKGKKMAGRMGQERVTVKNLKVVKFEKEFSKIYIKGAVPGNIGGKIEIRYEN